MSSFLKTGNLSKSSLKCSEATFSVCVCRIVAFIFFSRCFYFHTDWIFFCWNFLISNLAFLASLSEIGILAAVMGGACAVILILLAIFVAVRVCRKKRMGNDVELQTRESEWKDPTVWWGPDSWSCFAPLLVGPGVESGGYLGPFCCWKRQKWKMQLGKLFFFFFMFAPPMWTLDLTVFYLLQY